MPSGANVSTSTTNLISRLKSSLIAVGNGYYFNGTIGRDNYLNLKVGFVYSDMPINYTTVSGNDIISLSLGQFVNTLEKGDVYPGGNTASNVDYSFKLSNLSSNTTYYVRSYIKSGSTGYYKYGNQLSTTTLGDQSGYYISTDTIGFYDPLQIRNANEGVERVLTSDSSGLATWKPVKSLFTFGHYIGELYGGGVVVGVWKEGDDEKVLIVSTEDFADMTWSSGAAMTTAVGGLGLYNGSLNTSAIIAQSNTLGSGNSAAKVCADYRGSGYDDWYLPAYYELNQVYNQAAIVNKVLDKESLNFLVSDYWTSTEVPVSPNNLAIAFRSNLDNLYWIKDKSQTSRVRAVRKESIYTGDGLILNLDVTNKKSFSDIEYLNVGSASKWVDLVNGGLTSSYSFTFSSYQEFVDLDFPLTYYGPVYYPEESGFLRFIGGFQGGFSIGFIKVGSYVDFKAPIGNATKITIEMWVRLRGSYANKMLFGWNKYNVFTGSNGGLGFNTTNNDLYGISAATVQNLRIVDKWTHYVFEMNSNVSYTNNKIYINGNEQVLSQVAGTEVVLDRNFNSGLGRIGGARYIDPNLSGLLNGDVSVFRIYNRALTKDEIMKNYSVEKKRYEMLPVILTNKLLFNIDFDNTLSYSGDGTTSGVVTDLNGSGRTATLTISGTTVKPAVIKTSTLYNGKELVFTGVSSTSPYLFIPWGLFNMTTLSISFWVKFQENRVAEIIVKWNTADNTVGPWEVFQSGTKIAFRLRSTILTLETRVGTKTLTLGKWTHVCATYDNVTKKMKTYIDGILDIDSFVPNTFSITTALTGDIFIGQYPNTFVGDRYPLYGSIAQIQIYEKSLSYGEVKNNYDTDKFRFDNFSDANNFYSHEINGNPTFSISQNLSLDFGTASNEKILKMNNSGYGKLVDKTSLFTRPTNYRYIGELYGGGIIVAMWYYPTTIFNYLIMSLEDVSASTQWSNRTGSASNATSDFKGETNQTSILTQALHTTSAAKLCDDYTGGGFTDWYLPSVFEMNQAFNAGSIIDTALGSDLLKGIYWTSTEVDATRAYSYSFTSGTEIIDWVAALGVQKYSNKISTFKVRAFRVATNAPIVNPWNPNWDEEYTPWWGRTNLDWQPITYDTSDFDYFRRRNLKTGTVTNTVQGSFGTGFIITGNRITIWENVLEFGVCWTLGDGATLPAIPTINDNKVISTGSYDLFNSTISVSYYRFDYSVRVRVYATTNSGTYYGNLVTESLLLD